MNYYFDVKIQPDAEMRENVLLNKVYTKFHKALYSLNATDIGVSFPEYNVKLGKLMRVHGSKSRLKELLSMDWLGGLAGYCGDITILEIPESGVSYRTVSRKQATMTAAKMRRLLKRGSLSESEAKLYKANMFKKGLNHPYLELDSGSNGHRHRRYIVLGELLISSTTGQFDQFGLSRSATIPWFR